MSYLNLGERPFCQLKIFLDGGEELLLEVKFLSHSTPPGVRLLFHRENSLTIERNYCCFIFVESGFEFPTWKKCSIFKTKTNLLGESLPDFSLHSETVCSLRIEIVCPHSRVFRFPRTGKCEKCIACKFSVFPAAISASPRQVMQHARHDPTTVTTWLWVRFKFKKLHSSRVEMGQN